MQIKINHRKNKRPTPYVRTVRLFALWPTHVWHNEEEYIVWLSWFNQQQYWHRGDAWSGPGWRIESNLLIPKI